MQARGEMRPLSDYGR